MSNLPPGVTDQMCEGGPPSICANCGHTDEFHDYDEPCDAVVGVRKGEKIGCECPGFVDGEYEPDYDEDDD